METGKLIDTGQSLEPQPLEWVPVTREKGNDYLVTGQQAYRDHYCHLWPGGDPAPYISRNFNSEVLRHDLEQADTRLYLLLSEGTPAGICKWVLGKTRKGLPGQNPLFIEKIYFRKAHTGQGLGSALMGGILAYAREAGADCLWLEAMKKGPALSFYQKWGFRILGETQVPYPEVLPGEKDMWVLARPVTLPAHPLQ